jgi:hypothetical protein
MGIKVEDTNTVTLKITAADVFELFQAVYTLASPSIITVTINVEELTAYIVLEKPE